MTRLESTVRDNNTLRELVLNHCDDWDDEWFSPGPVPASVAEAMLKGAARNKRLEEMTMTVPDTAELHKLVDEVKKVNKKLRLYVEYCEVRVSVLTVFIVVVYQQLLECDGI